MKKIIIILTFFLLHHCGFEPIHSIKNIDSNNNFSIGSIGFSGENKINNALKSKLFNYLNKDEKIIQLDLTINSIVQKKITSKNKKGNPETFLMEIIINLEVFKDSELVSNKIFKEDFEYNNKSSQFELEKYEKNIQNNLSQKLFEYIIRHLYSIK